MAVSVKLLAARFMRRTERYEGRGRCSDHHLTARIAREAVIRFQLRGWRAERRGAGALACW